MGGRVRSAFATNPRRHAFLNPSGPAPALDPASGAPQKARFP
ncbi:hypothetical protein U91I_01847 [alpha proteobacterium U9-1i]|nr:hypothetical protein U91I_01847 [alpha proteobacterium U9-1i]